MADGDIINIDDVTLFREGVHGDTSATFLVGDVADPSLRLVAVTAPSRSSSRCHRQRPGGPVRDIS
ncbi:MAG: hypothetical protein R2695_02330 [Acidimicrobiales bacterium]